MGRVTGGPRQYTKPLPLAEAPARWATDSLPDWDAIVRALHAGGAKLLLVTRHVAEYFGASDDFDHAALDGLLAEVERTAH